MHNFIFIINYNDISSSSMRRNNKRGSLLCLVISIIQFVIAEAEATWQYVLADRKKRKSANSVTAYCERIAKVYSRNPPAVPKSPQKKRLLDKVNKAKQSPERPSPLPPLVPNLVSMYCPTLPMPGENGVKQHCKTIDISESSDETNEKREKPRWTGIVDVMFAYSEYMKGKLSICYKIFATGKN